MDETVIRKYAGLMQELNLTGLEVSENGTSLRLERAAEATGPALIKQTEPFANENDPEIITISSPMVGVFYSAPAENASPYIQVGDIVYKGDVLCIIEAMKLMNEIQADDQGRIVEICVKNGQVVDYGQLLFRLRKDPK